MPETTVPRDDTGAIDFDALADLDITPDFETPLSEWETSELIVEYRSLITVIDVFECFGTSDLRLERAIAAELDQRNFTYEEVAGDIVAPA